jgi:5-carboxymethyl-2-hydroxymuconate isomerase
MPHAIIEYAQSLTSQLDPKTLMTSVFDGAVNSALFDEADIKVRAMAFEYHQSGKSVDHFIHVTMKLLSGRTLEQRAYLSTCVMAELETLHLESLSLTVEVMEIERASYLKRYQ